MSSSYSYSSPNLNPANFHLQCECNRACGLYTCRKEGENQGRRFFRCQRYKTKDDCGFFKWADDAVHTTVDLKYQLIAQDARNKAEFQRFYNFLKFISAVVVFSAVWNIFYH
ncbi:hypothetical protein AXF42_Ash005389 [Apostasia shenzhenica]|uniref:GRF-type domain-containing protein n=1 Tax=Apostasia shenzhenica TaxID=1088818 RepID=A0A2I0B6R9_9ASPA|nr:hypothetical protein AXF42_Ash005389 [Apostasia shenzhenica]